MHKSDVLSAPCREPIKKADYVASFQRASSVGSFPSLIARTWSEPPKEPVLRFYLSFCFFFLDHSHCSNVSFLSSFCRQRFSIPLCVGARRHQAADHTWRRADSGMSHGSTRRSSTVFGKSNHPVLAIPPCCRSGEITVPATLPPFS